MSLLLNQIREKLAAIGSNSCWKLHDLPDDCPAYVYRDGIAYGVAIPYQGKPVAESFASATIHTRRLQLQDKTISTLAVECNIKALRYQFATLCESFANPGEDGSRRKTILEDPYLWWHEWRALLGNAIHEKAPYQILGEMLSVEHLITKGLTPTWSGPNGHTQDIQTASCNYEVKSTTDRYTTSITISSKFQLKPGDKPLKLLFARFEQDVGADSIDKVVKRMALAGCDKDELLSLLNKQGYQPGNESFYKEYRLLELRQYDVDSSFPLITDTSFVGGHLPDAVTHFTYTINLVGLPYVSLIQNG